MKERALIHHALPQDGVVNLFGHEKRPLKSTRFSELIQRLVQIKLLQSLHPKKAQLR